jgi:acetylglutamate kinase
MISEASTKASILVEALPYIRRWAGKTVVIKVGGEVVDVDETLGTFAEDVALMRYVGMQPVVVHGGGHQISQGMRDLGIEPRFIGGYRVTDSQTVDVVCKVLEAVNADIVRAIRLHGGNAAAPTPAGDYLLAAHKVLGPEGEDLGLVGEVERVNRSCIIALLEEEYIPVVAPIGFGPDGAYNINADLAAGAVAGSVMAEKIVFLTNVEGLYEDLGDAGSLISSTTAGELRGLMTGGSLSTGMIPKIRSVIRALEAGVPRAHILDGRVPHALLLEIFTDQGIGTMVMP